MLFAGLFAAGLHKVDRERISAFRTYYNAAKAMREGGNPYEAHHGTYAYVYGPLYAFLCQPLAKLSQSAAARVMLGINCALLLATLLAGARSVLSRLGHLPDWANVLWVAFLTSLIAICPIVKELLSFQSDFLILVSFVFAIVWLDEHPVWAGGALAIGIGVKYLPIIAVPYLLIRRRCSARSR